jgi:NAD+ kinase
VAGEQQAVFAGAAVALALVVIVAAVWLCPRPVPSPRQPQEAPRMTEGDGALRRVGIVEHGGRPAAVKAAEEVRRWCEEHGVAWADIDVWDADAPRRSAHDEAERAGQLDLVVTLGGDGTFLRGARVALAADAPVLGVDVGRVGFLTEVRVGDVEQALEAVHHGGAQVEERLTLTMRASRPLELPAEMESLLRYGRGPALPPPRLRPGLPKDVGWGVPLEITAVNDVVFEKLARDRQASVGVYLGDRLFASYSADAIIVASPTGSTAYSFSAGGPVLSPQLEGIVMTPVAPHMIFNRSLVVGADEVVSIRVLDRSGQVAVSVDGQLRGVMDPGDWVAVYAAPWRARLVRLHRSDFYGRLRDRFALADAPAAAADAGGAPIHYHLSTPPPADMRHLSLPPDED